MSKKINTKVETTSVSNVDLPDDILTPAKDRITEPMLEQLLSMAKLERMVDMELMEVYKNDPRYGERWHMQKAICLILDDHARDKERLFTIAELAYVIDQWFGKPNYGFDRAKADVTKWKKRQFKCQHIINAPKTTTTDEIA